jgi:hypothetical protein
VKAANAVQNAIEVQQTDVGKFEVPNWDQASQAKARTGARESGVARRHGEPLKDEVDPIDHLIGTAIGWGGISPGRTMVRAISLSA